MHAYIMSFSLIKYFIYKPEIPEMKVYLKNKKTVILMSIIVKISLKLLIPVVTTTSRYLNFALVVFKCFINLTRKVVNVYTALHT